MVIALLVVAALCAPFLHTTDPLFNPARFQYDPTKFEYVGTMDQDTRVCLTMGKSPLKTFADARTQQAIIAGTQAGSTTVDYPNFLNALAGTKFKLVQGYRGTDDVPQENRS